MKTYSLKKVITCEIGDDLGGYGRGVTSIAIHDDLYLRGLCLDDGTQKVLILSYDLVGIDIPEIEQIRKICAETLQIPEQNVMVTTTHNHSGPHTRLERTIELNARYLKDLMQWTREAAEEVRDAEFNEVDVYYYALHAKENINRRVLTISDNVCRFLPTDKELRPLADGFTDDELGLVMFHDSTHNRVKDILVNFAAHPLASHTPSMMTAGITITADFPGYLRDYVESQSGAMCTFVTGAAGDMFPIQYEQGFEAARRMGINLGMMVVDSISDILRHKPRFKVENPVLKTAMINAPLRLRRDKEAPTYSIRKDGMTVANEPLHLVAIGQDICFVGVPGELLAEVGMEIKWNSPFRKTFIVYNSTDYAGYLCHPNAFVSKGFEYRAALFDSIGGFTLLQKAVEAMYQLHSPEKAEELKPAD